VPYVIGFLNDKTHSLTLDSRSSRSLTSRQRRLLVVTSVQQPAKL
jgi:hypothetical protein